MLSNIELQKTMEDNNNKKVAELVCDESSLVVDDPPSEI